MELVLDNIMDLESVNIKKIKYVAIISRYENKWVIVRNKGTSTWEFPGGGIENNETPIEAAKRELFEETGALKASYTELAEYSVNYGKGLSYGKIFFAQIIKLGDLPESEVEEIDLVNDFPYTNTRYPKVQPQLFRYVENFLVQKYKNEKSNY